MAQNGHVLRRVCTLACTLVEGCMDASRAYTGTAMPSSGSFLYLHNNNIQTLDPAVFQSLTSLW